MFLSRYTDRHNNILSIITDYLKSSLPPSSTLYVDLPNNNPSHILFSNLRTDLAILFNSKIHVLELTVCHETNLASSSSRKLDRYKKLNLNLKPPFSNYQVKITSLEVSVLGFIFDITPFLKPLKIKPIPNSVLNKITLSAINSSKSIYYNRDNPVNDIT